MQNEKTIVIAATFTAEPARDSVQFWLERMRMPGRIGFAPQNQLIQTLLDPASTFAMNGGGLNVVLVRWQDLDRSDDDDRPLHDLVDALHACTARAKVPHLLITCPASPSETTGVRYQRYAEWDRRLANELAANPDISVVTSELLQTLYPSAGVHDSYGDRLALIPYSPAMFAAIGTMIAREFHVLATEPYKAIVVDCDGTLWDGACGEDGPDGIRLEPPHLALQEFLVSQSQQGVLICLCSKNNEEDVEAVFRLRADMLLQGEHLAARRVNWTAKPENLLSITEELRLRTESFIFLDDNPVECEAMRRSLPHVLTLRFSADRDDVPRWLGRVWAFDHPPATNEDRKRTSLYRQAREREELRKRSTTLAEFLAGLELEVECVPLDAGNLARASQLTFRVNQFNLTTIRRTEAELNALLKSGLKGFVVEVSDRFGDYGSVGLILYSATQDALRVDTFVLSCRSLGRGVEHRIVAHLASVLKASGLSAIELRLIPTAKNRPAQDFLETDLGSYRRQREQEVEYRVPVDAALAIRYRPGKTTEPSARKDRSTSAAAIEDLPSDAGRAERIAWIATEMLDTERILAEIEDWKREDPPGEQSAYVAPRTDAEQLLADIWAEALGLERVGVRDNFFSLGGDSLMMVRIIIKLHESTGVEFPLAAFMETPTIEAVAVTLTSLVSASKSPAVPSRARASAVPLQPNGAKPPFFFLAGRSHFGDRLGPEQPVYRVVYQDLDREQPLVRVEDMSAHSIKSVRAIQPEGPYYLGGHGLGGVVAFEIAQQLQGQGQEVAVLALCECRAPGPRASTPGTSSSYRLLQRGSYYFHRARRIGARQELASLLRGLKKKTQRAAWRRQTGPRGRSRQGYKAAAYESRRHYAPQVYAGRITVVRCAERVPWRNDDPLNGWGRLATDGVEAYEIPGSHTGIYREPNVGMLAITLNDVLHKAQARAENGAICHDISREIL